MLSENSIEYTILVQFCQKLNFRVYSKHDEREKKSCTFFSEKGLASLHDHLPAPAALALIYFILRKMRAAHFSQNKINLLIERE
jgi:hypothetical protein